MIFVLAIASPQSSAGFSLPTYRPILRMPAIETSGPMSLMMAPANSSGARSARTMVTMPPSEVPQKTADAIPRWSSHSTMSSAYVVGK